MPEYLAPGVYVEEVSFRAKSIEGVATSTTGFAGMTQYGPVQYPHGPKTTEPRLVGSLTEYESIYGGLDAVAPDTGERLCYMGFAVKSFFDNGGTRLYISRVFAAKGGERLGSGHPGDSGFHRLCHVARALAGSLRKCVVQTSVTRGKNIGVSEYSLRRASHYPSRGCEKRRMVEIYAGGATSIRQGCLGLGKLAVVQDLDGRQPQKFWTGPARLRLANGGDPVS